jgi:hypothetical protein
MGCGTSRRHHRVVDLGLEEPLFDRLRAEMLGAAFRAPFCRSPIGVAAAGPEKGAIIQILMGSSITA